MQMSDGEILHSWNNAAKPAEHVQILADLNAVSKEEMREKLLELGAEGVPAARKKRTPKATGEYKPVKLDELRAMALYKEGAGDLELADALGVTKSTVCKWRKMMRLQPNGQRQRRTGLDEARAMQLYNDGLCDLDMAEALGVSRNTVADWRKRNDLKCHRQAPGYVQKAESAAGATPPAADAATSPDKGRQRTGQDRTGQDRTGQDRTAEVRACWGGARGKARTYGCGRFAARDAARAGGFSAGCFDDQRALCA